MYFLVSELIDRKYFSNRLFSAFNGNIDLIVSGGASLDPKYIRAFETYGITALNGYDITECEPVVADVYLDKDIADEKDRIIVDIQEVYQQLLQIKNKGKVIIRDTEFPKTITKKIKRHYGGQ